jgi:hypothetical protein
MAEKKASSTRGKSSGSKSSTKSRAKSKTSKAGKATKSKAKSSAKKTASKASKASKKATSKSRSKKSAAKKSSRSRSRSSSSSSSKSKASSKATSGLDKSVAQFREALEQNVTLSRDRIQDVVDDAVKRGRMTRTDAENLLSELIQRGRKQTDALLKELERLAKQARNALP